MSGAEHAERMKRAARRLRAEVQGAVQGVGFRPFVYRLATELGLTGWVNNSPQGAVIEVEGSAERLQQFIDRLRRDRPRPCVIQSVETVFLPPAGHTAFELHDSGGAGRKTAIIVPDLATCSDCLREVFDASDRRYRYPFTNCTICGPRFSIIEALPYDRPRTTMKGFVMCARCREEYEDPGDRRFHAQPNACPVCGPHLELWDTDGRVQASQDDALRAAADALRDGEVLAVKGLGGFHLMADARNPEAVKCLRRRKNREEKPFALLYPDLPSIQHDCEVSPLETELLLSPQAPIVLLRRGRTAGGRWRLADAVAPGNPYLGIMLPYTPLHHLLTTALGFPLIATSGNRSDEPICTDEREALTRLGGIADRFLVHNRPIRRHVDDSVIRVVLGRELVLRRSRGYAPLPVRVPESLPALLGVGAHLKNTVAISVADQVVLSQHIGDLETAPALDAFKNAVADLEGVYALDVQAVVCDLHPDYLSTRFAERSGRPVIPVQHHEAHVRACMAENGLSGPVLGVSWDGTGYGTDGTVWGGEFLQVEGRDCTRRAHFRPFRLPGGDAAVREPRRVAIGLLFELLGEDVFRQADLAPMRALSPRERRILHSMLRGGVNAPRTSSAGRLFDAVASLVGVRQVTRFEGQAAMELEFVADGVISEEAYPFRIDDRGVIDWAEIVLGILADVAAGLPTGQIAAKFHNGLVEIIVAVARRVNEPSVVLTGGCFQNVRLLESAVRGLRGAGFQPWWHRWVPPNDGGIALGQVMAVAARWEQTPNPSSRLAGQVEDLRR
jgi:hydrogenase maturation protein HypF